MRKASGFTLIELMTVIFMLALLSAFAVPGIISWRSAAKLRAAAENLKGDLELAKLKAIQENGPVSVHFKEDGYQIFVDTGATAGILDADERLLKNISLPVGIKFAPKTFGEAGDAWPRKTRFFGRGTADNGTAFLKDEKRTEGKKIIISNLAKITVEKYEFE